MSHRHDQNQKNALRGAVLDLGSNSFKLMLAEQCDDVLNIHFEKAFVTRIGEGLEIHGEISAIGMERALRVIKQSRTLIKDFGVDTVQVVGTSALRTATNAGEFLDRASEILMQPVQVISGSLEARLVYAGIVSSEHWRNSRVICADLGGGSLELNWGDQGEWEKGRSFAVGCVRMKDTWQFEYPLVKNNIEKAWRHLRAEMGSFLKRASKVDSHTLFVGSGGSMGTLCSIHAEKFLPFEELEGFTLTLDELKGFVERVSKLTLQQIKRIPLMPHNRADLMLPAALTYIYVMKSLGFSQIHCATRGLRYGVWYQWIKPFKHVKHACA